VSHRICTFLFNVSRRVIMTSQMQDAVVRRSFLGRLATSRIARTVAADAGMSASEVEADLRAQEKGFAYTYVG
jgi:hypothetical protein